MKRTPSSMLSQLLGALLLLLVTTTQQRSYVEAVDFFINPWLVQTYDDRTAAVGDTMTFIWPQGTTHNVYIHPSGSCDETGAVEVGTTSGATYTFTEPGTITFACDIGEHCEAGQFVNVNVLAATTTTTEEPTTATTTTAPTATTTTTAPVPAPTMATTTTTTTAPAGDEVGLFDPCFVCGPDDDGTSVPLATGEDDTITLPGDDGPTLTCQEVYDDGLAGIINPSACMVLQDIYPERCRCRPEGFTCSICGLDENGEQTDEIKLPTGRFQLPMSGNELLTCSDVEEDAMNGLVTPLECQQLIIFGYTPCQCAPINFTCSICGEGDGDFEGEQVVTNPDGFVNTIIGLDDGVTCGELQTMALAGDLTPTQCAQAEATVAAGCGCAPPDFVCNVCGTSADGVDQIVFAPDAEAVFPGEDGPTTCGELEELGQTPNGLTPGQCDVAQNVGVTSCQCNDPDYSCSICGEGQVVMNADAMLTIPAAISTSGEDETLTCGEAEMMGMMGTIPPLLCSALQGPVQTQCLCEVAEVTPSVSPTVVETTSAPSVTTTTTTITDAPSVGPTALVSSEGEANTTTEAPVMAPTEDAAPVDPTDVPIDLPSEAPTSGAATTIGSVSLPVVVAAVVATTLSMTMIVL